MNKHCLHFQLPIHRTSAWSNRSLFLTSAHDSLPPADAGVSISDGTNPIENQSHQIRHRGNKMEDFMHRH